MIVVISGFLFMCWLFFSWRSSKKVKAQPTETTPERKPDWEGLTSEQLAELSKRAKKREAVEAARAKLEEALTAQSAN